MLYLKLKSQPNIIIGVLYAKRAHLFQAIQFIT